VSVSIANLTFDFEITVHTVAFSTTILRSTQIPERKIIIGRPRHRWKTSIVVILSKSYLCDSE
jgi:hypothetical protein